MQHHFWESATSFQLLRHLILKLLYIHQHLRCALCHDPQRTMSHVFMSIMSSCELLSIRHLDVLRLKARVFHTHIHTPLTSTRKNEVSNLKGPVKASHVSVQIASIPLQSVTVKTSTALSHQPSAMLIGD